MINCKKINHKDIKEFWVCNSKEEAVELAAEEIIKIVKDNPKASITYATGNTKIPVYAYISNKIKNNQVDFSKTTAFHLDEYFPISPTNQYGFVKYLYQNVFDPFKINPSNINVLDGDNPDYQGTCDEYNKKLSGGVDLCILGIGPGSHIGFNESGTSFESMTHLAILGEGTIYRDRVERGQNTPDQALTQGIGNILESKKIILSAFGLNNAEPIYNAFFKEISEEYPASALRNVGSKVTVIIDKEAASKINQL